MKVFFFLSTLLHVLFLLIAWIWEDGRGNVVLPDKLVLRIARVGGRRPVRPLGRALEDMDRVVQDEVSRNIPLPVARVNGALDIEDIAPIQEFPYLESTDEGLAVDSEYVSSAGKMIFEEFMEPLDPLSGIDTISGDDRLNQRDEAVLSDKKRGNDNFKGNVWHLSWLNTEGRDMIFSPEIKLDGFVFDVDRLLDMVVRIDISPEGSVLDADILPPGSGDVKLDRYIYSRTLEIVMEPAADSDKIAEAELHLTFKGRRG